MAFKPLIKPLFTSYTRFIKEPSLESGAVNVKASLCGMKRGETFQTHVSIVRRCAAGEDR